MSVPIGPLTTLGLKAVELLSRIKVRKPKDRAKAHRGRAALLNAQADALATEVRRHELNAATGDAKSQRFHTRRARSISRRVDRLRNKAWWWTRRAERLDPR